MRDSTSDLGNSSSGVLWDLQQAGRALLYKQVGEQSAPAAVQWRGVDALSGAELWRHDDDALLNDRGWVAQWQQLNYSFLD